MKSRIGPPLLFLLAACGSKPEFAAENFTRGMNDYLQQRGNLCLAKYDWPIDVLPQELPANSRNALQMPVLEQLGLVVGMNTSIERKTEGGVSALSVKQDVKQAVKRYVLTDAGKKYFVTRKFTSAVGERKVERSDLCVAKLSLDKILAVKKIGNAPQPDAASVTYTYDIEAAPWTRQPDFDRVFPVIDRVIRGAKRAQLKQTFTFTGSGWVASDLLK